MMDSVSKMRAVHQADINHKNFIRKQQRIEAAKESAEEISKLESENLVNSSADVTTVQGPSIYQMVEVDYNNIALNQVIDENKLGDIFNKIIDDSQADLIFDFIEDDRECKEKSEKLLDHLLGSDESLAEDHLGQFFNNNKLSQSQIFGVLAFLLAQLSKQQQKKKKLEALIAGLLEKYTEQNATYLAGFFDIMQNPEIKKNTNIANGFAKLNSGEITINSIKSAMVFIENHLDGNFEKIVSKCVRLRLHVLQKLSSSQRLDRESTLELSAYTSFVKNLLLVNSGYSLVDGFRQKSHLADSDVEVETKMTNNKILLLAIIELIELRVVTNITFKNLLRRINLSETRSDFGLILKKMILLLEEFPNEFYGGIKDLRLQIMKGFNTVLKTYTKNQNNTASNINIFKPRKELINFI